MLSELFSAGGSEVAIKVTPGASGVFQVYFDGDLVFDKKAEGNQTPHLGRAKELKALLKQRIEKATQNAGVKTSVKA
jgi:predicted Rdx family selenoprotein